ncbi:MAG: putative rane protein [Myxococcaceae bacterium]|nr:putative rane protein [Myxococcaceae bacterium]
MIADVISYPRSQPIGSVLTLGVAVFFVCMGASGLFNPKGVVERFGMTADTPDARAEIRAVYGGFGIGVAALLAFALTLPTSARHAIWMTIGVCTLSMALGRATRLFDGGRARFNPTWLFFLVELALTGALAAATVLD